jgi:purine-binding chemotaxis protein CheW
MTSRGEVQRLVTFGIGSGWYAADVAHVERVVRREGICPIPGMPPWMEGILAHAGGVVPVIDLRARFGLDGVAEAGGGRLLLLSLGREVVAAAVDRVVDVRAVPVGEVAPPPRLMRGISGEFLRGVVRRGDTMVLVLDVPRLIGPDDRLLLDGVLSRHATPPAGAVPVDAPDLAAHA